MSTLDALAIKYQTDKSSRTHNYAVKYDAILGARREAVSRVLEIGVFNGASLRMWEEYFQNAQIIGMDNDWRTRKHGVGRASILVGDQSRGDDLDAAARCGPFDLIVDDGSHHWSDQIRSFKHLFGAVRPGGIYIVEDVCTSYWGEAWGSGPPAIEYFASLIAEANFYGERAGGINDRREALLLPVFPDRGVASVHFLNSLVVVHKREEQ